MEDVEPEEFLDPITLSLMEEAMMTAKCGHSFSKASITAWLRQNHPTCPVCKTALREDQLVPNYALRSAIERYQNQHPDKQASGADQREMSSHSAPSYTDLPDAVKPKPSSSSGASQPYAMASAPAEIDLEADAARAAPVQNGGGGGDDDDDGCDCMPEMTREARHSEQGCLTCTCDGPVYCCATAYKCEQPRGLWCSTGHPWYVSPSAKTCTFFYGSRSTYKRRTWGSLCLPLLALLLGVELALELVFIVVFWVLATLVISPIWLILRAPVVALCPLYYAEHVKPGCWDQTFGCLKNRL